MTGSLRTTWKSYNPSFLIYQLLIVDKEPLAIQKKLLAIAVATKNTPTEVTNEEIDALLSMAKRDIKKHYII